MTDEKKPIEANRLVGGILGKLGEGVDKIFGRAPNQQNKLATSGLIENLKTLIDGSVQKIDGGRFAPHVIRLRMEWGKFSVDSPEALKKLEHELLAAAIDHINDNRYRTFAPLRIEIKPDYFSEDLHLTSSFEGFGTIQDEKDIRITAPSLPNVGEHVPTTDIKAEPEGEIIIAEFTANGKQKLVELHFTPGKNRLSVGRTKENDLFIDDATVSKIHASLVLKNSGVFMVADTGSTNGTAVNDQRLAYGKAMQITEADRVSFGDVKVFFRRAPTKPDLALIEEFVPPPEEVPVNETVPEFAHDEPKHDEFKTNEDFVFADPRMDVSVKPQPTDEELDGKNLTIKIDY